MHGAVRRHTIGCVVGLPVVEQQFVAAAGFEHGVGGGAQTEATRAEARGDGAAGVGMHVYVLAFTPPRDGAGVGAIVIVECDVVGEQHAQRAPRRTRNSISMRCVISSARVSTSMLVLGIAIEPATAARRDGPCRRLIEQAPAALLLDERALAERAEQAEIAARRRQQPIDADMALGQHGIEHAAHQHGAGQRTFVRHQCATAAQDLGMRALHGVFLGRRYPVQVAGMKARDGLGAALFFDPRRAELRDEGRQRRGLGGKQRRAGEERAWQRDQRDGRCHAGIGLRFGQRTRGAQMREIGGAAGARMVGREAADEAALRAHARRERERRVLQADQCVFVLQAHAGQAVDQRDGLGAGARRRAVKLQCIGRIADRAMQRGDETPGMTAAHGEVLARGDDATVRGVEQRRVVEILAREVFAGADEVVVGEPEILAVDDIDRQRLRVAIAQRHVPEPGCAVAREAQADTIAHALPHTAHGKAIVPLFEARGAARPEQRGRRRTAAETAQVEIARPAFHGVAAKQVEHQRFVIDARHRGVGVDGEAQSGGVGERAAGHG
jgi:hypothetical protein